MVVIVGMMTMEIRAKFIEFDNNNDCICVNEDGKEIRVDPFVGCAFEFEQREHLIGQWFKMGGHYYKDGTFLVSEGEMKIINPHQP